MIGKKKSFFLLIVLIAPLDLSIVKANDIDHNDIECFLDAIAEVETENNPHAIGDKGRAIGLYQIHRAYWQDGTRILGVDWDYAYAFDPKKSRKVVKAYLLHYGKGKSFVDMARIHNGGPKGYKKKSTLSYARKVETLLQSKKLFARHRLLSASQNQRFLMHKRPSMVCSIFWCSPDSLPVS